MATTYLVDFENVHDSGLRGIHTLSNEDVVNIIYTNNANKISLDCFNNTCVPITVIKVEGGSQSLDMHLVSFLGYLIGQESDPNESYVIISQDTDYSNVAAYWCDRYGYADKVTIQPTISGEPIKTPNNNVNTYHDIAADRIRAIIQKHGTYGNYGRMILISSLCSNINNYPAFMKERERLNLKGMKLLATFDDVIDIRQFNNTDWAVLKSSVFIQETGNDTGKSDVILETDPDLDLDDNPDIETFEVPDIEELDSKEVQPQIAETPVATEENHNTANCAGTDSSHPNDSMIEEIPVHSSDSENPDVDVLRNEPQRSVMEINLQCKQSLCDAAIQKGYPEELASEIASAAFSNLNQEYKRIDIYHSFLRKFGRVKGAEYYKLIKWMRFPEYNDVVPSTVSTEDLGNNDDCEQILNSTESSESFHSVSAAESENKANCQSEIPSDCNADPSGKGNFEANSEPQISEASDTNTYESLTDCPLDSMNLPIRVHNALDRAGYRYARQFIYMPDEELLKIRYLGMKGVTIIRDWVSAHTRDQSDY